MMQVPLKRDINKNVNGCSGFATSTQKWPFMEMLISRSRGTCLIELSDHDSWRVLHIKYNFLWKKLHSQLAYLSNLYTVYHRFGGRRFMCFGFDPASAMVQKQNTRNVYLRTDDKRCTEIGLSRCTRLGEVCSRWCLRVPLLPKLSCNIHATWSTVDFCILKACLLDEVWAFEAGFGVLDEDEDDEVAAAVVVVAADDDDWRCLKGRERGSFWYLIHSNSAIQ